MTAGLRKPRRLNGWRALALALFLFGCYLGSLPVRIYLAGTQDRHTRADVIIVLGARQNNGRPSQALRARLDHALALYQHGDAPYLLFTGGKQHGDVYTEAGTGRRYALRRDVPDGVILLEPQGRTTLQSLQSCTDIMRRHGFKTAILVSDPFHTLRLQRMARDLGMRATVSPTPFRARNPREFVERVVHEAGAYAVYRLFGWASNAPLFPA